MSYVGPIPPPAVLQAYNKIVPGSAKRIIDNALKQSEHRRKLEAAVIEGDNRRANLGLYLGGALSGLSILGGIVLVGIGQAVAGATIATGSVVGLAAVFVYGSISRRLEREHKAEVIKKIERPNASSDHPPRGSGPSSEVNREPPRPESN